MPALRPEELDRAAATFNAHSTRANSPWDEFRNRYLALPDWYDATLDPFSSEYAAQQDRLWQLMAGREHYEATEQEQTPEVADQEAIYQPAFYVLREPGTMALAGQQMMATGHFLKIADIQENDFVLEYGAGYGQTALAFARMGARVHTVDINPMFCRAVQAQGEFFKVRLKAFVGAFGDNPRGRLYKLIFFYEAFHHCRDFLAVIGKLRAHLTADGKILLGGEPITTNPADPSIPYAWGMRLDAENAAVVRHRGWYELGFQESFLVQCFIRQGFSWRKHPCEASPFAIIHEFRLRKAVIELATEHLAPSDADTWHGMEAHGRWTRARSTLTLDTRADALHLGLSIVNHHPTAIEVTFTVGAVTAQRRFQPRERLMVNIVCTSAPQLEICCTPQCPARYGSADQRLLGVFVEQLTYLEAAP